MKEYPILMADPMALAILEGRKTQARRAIKDQEYYNRVEQHGSFGAFNSDPAPKCPFGNVGDRLWVREAFAYAPVKEGDLQEKFIYRSTDEPNGAEWQPDYKMPRRACRLVLEITGIWTPRLQDISEADAKAEGAKFHDGGGIGNSGYRHDPNDGFVWETARESFAHLWDSLVTDVTKQFDANPWVWALTFKKVKS